MSTVRLFAALELPGEVRAALASWGARVSAREPAVRLVSTEALHVTLVFLGAQPADDLEAIGRVVIGEARPLDPLAVSEAAWLPPRRPGVLVADLVEDGDRLARLQADLAEALMPWAAPEQRAYRPHITVARVRHGQQIARREVPAPPRLTFDVPALVLYRSFAEPEGSRYEAVARIAL
ncbi:MAG: 2-5 ligase [Solirubrobacterales bacterium]|nr:2-5 ligase [Solirubrobacterales bacterium]